MNGDLDLRIPRENRIELDEKEYKIEKCVPGGSSICYFTETSDGKKYVIKELYPREIACRDEKQNVCPVDQKKNRIIFELYKSRFWNEFNFGQKSFYKTFQIAAYYEKLDEARNMILMTPAPEDLKDLNAVVAKFQNETPLVRLRKTLDIVKSLVAGLQKLHEGKCRLLHLDLSLSNVLVGKSGDAVMVHFLDFGEARKLQDGIVPVTCREDMPGTTAEFSAPERWKICDLKPAADLYSAGAIMFHLLCTGVGAYRDTPIPDTATLSRFGCDEVRYGISKLGLPARIASEVTGFLKKALAWFPENRFQSAKEMLAAIKELTGFVDRKGITRSNLRRGSEEVFEKTNQGYIGGTMDESMLPELDGELSGNVMLIGPGGGGKTTLLYHTWNRLLEEAADNQDAPVPLYVPLYSFEGWRPVRGTGDPKNGTFLQDHIIKYYAGSPEGTDIDNTCRAKLLELFREGHYTLLLDGVNESINSDRLKDEIAELSKFENLDIIITSRHELSWLKNTFNVVNVLPLDDETVWRKTGKTNLSPRLFDVLHRPMFLALYCNMMRDPGLEKLLKEYVQGWDAIQSPGEILLAHHLRLIRMNEENTGDYDSRRVRKFLLNTLFPYFAVRCDSMQFQSDTMYDLTAPRLENVPARERGTVGLINADPEMMILPNLISMGLIREVPGQSDTFVFAHQIYHEFYRAMAIKQEMQNLKGELPAALSEGPVEESVLALLGDLWGEYSFEDKIGSPIENWMQKNLNGKRGEAVQMTVRNLVECMKISRHSCITASYDGLDLRMTQFIDCKLPGSSFTDAQLSMSTFISNGHKEKVDGMAISPNKNYLISCEKTKLFCWDIRSGLQKYVFVEENELPIRSVDISPDEKYILVNFYSKTLLYVLDLDDGSIVSSYQLPWRYQDKNSEYRYMLNFVSYDDFLTIAAFLPDSETILLGSSNGVLWHINAKNGKQISHPKKIRMQPMPEFWDVENELTWCSNYYEISNDRRKLVVMHRNATLEMWNTVALKRDEKATAELQEISGGGNPIFSLDDRYVIRRLNKTLVAYNLETGEIVRSPACDNFSARNVILGNVNGAIIRSFAQEDYFWDLKHNKISRISNLPCADRFFYSDKINTYFYVDHKLQVHFMDAETMVEWGSIRIGHNSRRKVEHSFYSCGCMSNVVMRVSWSGQLQVLNEQCKKVDSLTPANAIESNSQCYCRDNYLFVNNLRNEKCMLWIKNSNGFTEISLPALQGHILYVDVNRNSFMVQMKNSIYVFSLTDPPVELYGCNGEGRWLEPIEFRYEDGRKIANINGKDFDFRTLFNRREEAMINIKYVDQPKKYISKYCVIPELDSVVSYSYLGFLRVWDIRTGNCVFKDTIKHGPVKAINRIPHTNYVLIETRAMHMILWDMKQCKQIATWREGAGFWQECYSLDGKEEVRLFLQEELNWDISGNDITIPEAIAILLHRPHSRSGRSVVKFSEDKQRIAVWTEQNNNIRVWKGEKNIKIIHHHFNKLSDFCLNEKGDSLYIQGDNGVVYCYDVDTDEVGVDVCTDKIYDKLKYVWGNVDAYDVSECNFIKATCEKSYLKVLLKMNGAIVE